MNRELYRYVCGECGEEELSDKPLNRATLCEYCNHPYKNPVILDREPQATDFPPNPNS